MREPWYNYHVGTLVHASRALDVYRVAPTLFLANDHTGHTELRSLFLDQSYRHGRNGPLLSKSRLLFIAEFAQRFAPKLISELRGKLDAQGKSPFWDGLGRHFFAMEYSTADYLTGIGQRAFLAELMPRHPVYVTCCPTAIDITWRRVDTGSSRPWVNGRHHELQVDSGVQGAACAHAQWHAGMTSERQTHDNAL